MLLANPQLGTPAMRGRRRYNNALGDIVSAAVMIVTGSALVVVFAQQFVAGVFMNEVIMYVGAMGMAVGACLLVPGVGLLCECRWARAATLFVTAMIVGALFPSVVAWHTQN